MVPVPSVWPMSKKAQARSTVKSFAAAFSMTASVITGSEYIR